MAVNFKLLRTSTANKRPTAAQLGEGELALNFDAADPGLFFEDDDGDIRKVGPTTVAAVAPNTNPQGSAGNSTGEMWLDTSTTPNVLKVYDGTQWVVVTDDVAPLPFNEIWVGDSNGAAVGTNYDNALTSFTGLSPNVSSKELSLDGDFRIQNEQELKLLENIANGGSFIGFKAPANVTTSTTFTVPDGDGNANEVLTTDGSGNLSWSSNAALPSLTNGQIFVGNGSNQTVQDDFDDVLLAQGNIDATASTGTQITLTNARATFANGVTAPAAAISNAGAVDFAESTTNGSNIISFKAPDAVTTSTQFTFPDGDGDNGDVLGTDGNGTLSWVDPQSGQKGQKGVTGANGSDGAKGQKGVAGTNGTNGSKGQKGDTGADGQKGATGTGSKGQKGQTGGNGTAGEKGQKGATGDTGAKGATGSTGADGAKGDTGAAGTNGSDGAKGQKGVTGGAGNDGSKGQKGVAGEDGTNGTNGTDGAKGQKGVEGTGNDGAKGEKGASGTAASKGQKGEAGSDGAKGTAGTNGTDGSKGQKGQQGTKGTDGQFGGATFDYDFLTDTGSTDPGSGNLKLNNATVGSATELYIDDEDQGGTDISSFLQTIDNVVGTTKGYFRVANRLDATDFAVFTISDLTDNTGWWTVNCSYVTGPGSFANGEDIIISFSTHGDTGAKGQKGVAGVDGSKGQKGVTGAGGSNGSDGAKGQKGVAGTNGSDGSKGQTGADGSKGQKGVAGTNGTNGSNGSDGAKGQKGASGTNGTNGSDGAKGQKGVTGQKGATGANGTDGTNGDKGQKGDTGAKGDTGQKGATGTGDTGAKGEPGAKGQKGQTGGSGQKGATGATGGDGAKGQKGVDGDKGQKGVDGTAGSKGTTGGDGSKGQKGVKGGPAAAAGSTTQVQYNNAGTVAGTSLLRITGGDVQVGSNVIPSSDNAHNLGSASFRFANIFTGDLHLANDRGDWTIIEEADCLTMRNNLTGKRYNISMTERPE